MALESLANEVLLDLFTLIDGIDLLRAFHGLNCRFNGLLFTHFRAYSFDFRSVSKTDLSNFCQQYFSSIVERTVSLCLSDDDETPQKTTNFFLQHFTLRHFESLQSLSLYSIDSQQTMDRIMDETPYLFRLIHLSVVNCKFQSEYFQAIWRLPKLSRFLLRGGYTDNVDLSVALTRMSLSLQNISILDRIMQAPFLERLLKNTPSLRHLSLGLVYDYHSLDQSLIIPMLEIVKLSLKYSISPLENLVKHMPNLSHLTVRTPDVYIDGYQWESFIMNYSRTLKTFRLMMQFRFDGVLNSEEQAKEILESFRTPFWIEEHSWFVRCHWNEHFGSKLYSLYTLPFTLNKFSLKPNLRFQSTSPDEENSDSYKSVHYLSYDFGLCRNLLRINFPNLSQLDLAFPINNFFCTIIPTLHRLASLCVTNYNDNSDSTHLQIVLDRAPQLYSLRLESKLSISHSIPLKITSTSIRRVYLRHYYLNRKACDAWCRSPLGMQCQVLSIDDQDASISTYLIDNMKNLRRLKIRRKDVTVKTIDTCSNEKPIECLQQYVPLSRHKSL